MESGFLRSGTWMVHCLSIIVKATSHDHKHKQTANSALGQQIMWGENNFIQQNIYLNSILLLSSVLSVVELYLYC